MVEIRFILFTLVLFSCGLISQNIEGDSSRISIDEEYINPSYSFSSREIKEKGQGYPHAIRIYPGGDRSFKTKNRFLRFLDYVKKEFKESNMTVKEAEDFYALLKNHIEITDGYFGMPSPNLPRPKPVVFEERVMIKKLNDSQYTIFYYRVGCGCRYIYSEVIKKGEELKFEDIEVWALRYPC